MILRNHSITTKLIFITALSSSLALLAFSFILFFYETTFVKRDLINNLQTQVEIITENSLASLAFMDASNTRKTLGALKHNPDILYAGLYDNQQQLLDAYRDESYQEKLVLLEGELSQASHLYETDHFVQIVQPIILNSERLGYLVLRASFASFDKKLHDYMTIIFMTFCVTLLAALYLASHLQRIVSRPIIRLVDFIYYVTESKTYDVTAVKESNDEFGKLVDAFNNMLTQLNYSFQKRDEAEKALSHHLNHLKEIVNEQTLDLQRALDVADAANRSKSDFLANMSHEIRTPMNAIVGMTHLAQRTHLDDKQRNYLEKIDTATQMLLNIINDILDFSKIEAGKLTLENLAFSLDNVLTHLLDMIKIRAEQKNIGLSFVVSPDVPRQLLGDSLRIGQILINLVSNAVKFTEKGEVVMTVESRNRSEHAVALCFTIRDTGIGMTTEQINGLFQPFSQGDTSTTRKYGGTGLGLTICKQLAQLMGGEIRVASAFGSGSTFTFNVTLALASNQSNSVPEDEIPYCANPHYNAQRILLVEDNEINQQVALELLTSMDLQVALANNGKEGVERAMTEMFDLILMDIQMPVMDGLTATKLIRAEPRLKDLPIVAMTAHAMEGDREKSLAAGMNDHLTKPIEVDRLVVMLNHWLTTSHSKTIQSSPKLQVSELGLLPNQLPPFDLAQALIFSNHNSRLLHQLLLSFRNRYADTANQLVHWIEAKNFTQAEHIAHSLKGVAGTLAANELKNTASALEIALYNKQFDDLNGLLHNLVEALSNAIDAAMTLPTLSEPKNDVLSDLNTEELEGLLNQLQFALKSNHFNALEIFNHLKPYLLCSGFHQDAAMLTHLLEQLDFQQALPVLTRIQELLTNGK